MNKHPLSYTREDIEKIIDKMVKIDVGDQNSNIINETVVGKLIKCDLAANGPYLPTAVHIKTKNGATREISFSDMIQINVIE